MSLLSIDGGKTKKLKRLRRKSHFLMNEPSVSIKYSYFYFSASAFEQLDAKKYSSCAFSIEDGVAPEEALKLYIELNNEPEGELNCPINFNKTNSIFTVGCTATIVQQIPRLKILQKKSREERRIFLKYDEVQKLWYLPLVPGFEYRCRDPQNLDDAKGIYRLAFNGNVQYIGETNNLSRRIYEHIKQEEIKFDEIQYSILNNQTDEERKEWEAFHLDLVVKETGLLPPHNRNRGKLH